MTLTHTPRNMVFIHKLVNNWNIRHGRRYEKKGFLLSTFNCNIPAYKSIKDTKQAFTDTLLFDTQEVDQHSKNSRQTGSSPHHGMYRGTMVTFTVLSLVSLAYASFCPPQPQAKIVIRVPRGFQLGKILCRFLLIMLMY